MLISKNQVEQMFYQNMEILYHEGIDNETHKAKAKQLCENQIKLLEEFSPGEVWCFNGYDNEGNVQTIRLSGYIRIMRKVLSEI